MKITHAAYYIIENYHSIQGGITPLKLQKLLYYLKVWGIVSGKELLESGQFKAWKNGPVNSYVYHQYNMYITSIKSMEVNPFLILIRPAP